MVDARTVDARVDKHEAVCAERYNGINAQLRRLEKWLVGGFGLTVTTLLAVILRGL